MAKPIKATPTLVGEEADKFVEKMLIVEKARVTASERRFAKQIEDNMGQLLIC